MNVVHNGVVYSVWDTQEIWALCFVLKLQQGAA